MSYLRIIRNHWKKSAFAFCATSYAAYTIKNHLEVTKNMRNMCTQIMLTSQTGGPPKKVVVLLNPVANRKKSEKLFKKYCEPILHLSGYTVEIIKTNHGGHAKVIVENMEKLPDALVVAGGDGTYSEVVTGLMRRNDQPCPILLLPLGQKNETVFELLEKTPGNYQEYVKSLPGTLMPLLREKLLDKSVIRFDVIDSSKDSVRPIFGLNKLSWGILRDIESIKDKYWFFGKCRHYAAAFFNAFSSDLKWKFTTNLEYTPPCPGCTSCIVKRSALKPQTYFGKVFIAHQNQHSNANLVKNKNCNVKQECQLEANQIVIACRSNSANVPELQTSCINSIKPGFEFIQKISSITRNEMKPSVTLSGRTIEINPVHIQTDTNTEDAKWHYSIDGEEYDVRPVKITIVPNALKLYC